MDYRLNNAMKLLNEYIARSNIPNRKELTDLTLDQIRDIAIASALNMYAGNKTKAAKHLGVSRQFLITHCNRLGLS